MVTFLLTFVAMVTRAASSSYNIDLTAASDYFPTAAETDVYSSTENGLYYGYSEAQPTQGSRPRPTALPESSQKPFADVQTSSGVIRGLRKRMPNRRIVNTFLGVPYAEPPVGPRRFRNVNVISPWEGVKNTTLMKPACWQAIDESFGRHPGVEMWNVPGGKMSEDCLYANLWVPHRCLAQKQSGSSRRCAILVWVYGGTFVSGSANLDVYDGSLLASLHHVIVVSFNYRIGPFGFLYFGSVESAPGNMGLMDQQVALKWVHDNADYFGGNKSQITLFGESAGAASVSLHLFAKKSMPYFRNAILQSSSHFGRWVIKSKDFARKRAFHMATLVGCFDEGADPVNASLIEVAECMRSVSPRELTDQQWNVQNFYFEATFPPIIDGYFIEKSPEKSMAMGEYKKTNILLGANKDEGSYFLLYGFLNEVGLPYPKPPQFDRATYLRMLQDIVGDNKLQYAMTKYVYDDTKMWRPSHLQVLSAVVGDREFLCPIVDLAKAYAQRGHNVYMYHFTHRTSVSPWPEWMGVLHGDEIEYIFGVPLRSNVKVHQPNQAEADDYTAVIGTNRTPRPNGKFIRYNARGGNGGKQTEEGTPQGYTYSEYRLSWAMTKFWTNFAKTDDPNIETRFYPPAVSVWPRYSVQDQKFIYFNTSRSYTIGKGMRHSECVYWTNIVDEYLESGGMDGSESAQTSQASSCGPHSLITYVLIALIAISFFAVADVGDSIRFNQMSSMLTSEVSRVESCQDVSNNNCYNCHDVPESRGNYQISKILNSSTYQQFLVARATLKNYANWAELAPKSCSIHDNDCILKNFVFVCLCMH